MSHSTHAHPKHATILGEKRVPDGGVLVIPSRLSYADLIRLEQILAPNPVVYLVKHGASLSPQLKAHLNEPQVHALEFAPTPENIAALRKEIQDEVTRGAVVVYVPQETAPQNAPLCTVPGAKLDFLMQIRTPVLPLHVVHTPEVAMAVDPAPHPEQAIFAFGEVLKEPDVPSYQSSLMALSVECFALEPSLQMHLAYALLKGLKKHAGRVSIIDGKDDKELGYDKVLAAAIVLAKHVRSVTKRERVGVILPPGIGGLIANVAVLFAGKIPVNLNFTAGRAAAESAIRQAELDHFLTADLFVRKMQNFPWPPNRQLTFIERLLPTKKAAIAKWLVISKLLPASILATMIGVPKKGGNKEALLLFTSGSSGEPKGVALTHRNLMANVCQFSARLNLGPGDRILGSLPLFHSFGGTVTLWYPIIEGIGLVTYPSPIETKKLGELIHKHKVTIMIATPTFLRGYMRGVNPEWLASLKLVVTGAEKLPKTVADAFESRFGKKVYEGYGLTETSPVSNVNLPNPEPGDEDGAPLALPTHRFGSVGQLIPGLAVRITHPDTGEPLSIHQSGMIWFKGANVFTGYLKNPKLTDEVIQDGWFRTGDIGRMDSDGFLYIEGRLSRFSKIAGEMVPHETVEEHLVKALGIESETSRRIAIVGVPDIDKGEALILLTSLPGGSVQQEILDLRYKLLDRGMPPLWIPKKMIRVADIPVLASGKLDVKACENIAKSAGW